MTAIFCPSIMSWAICVLCLKDENRLNEGSFEQASPAETLQYRRTRFEIICRVVRLRGDRHGPVPGLGWAFFGFHHASRAFTVLGRPLAGDPGYI
jgi:hypothetical protein